MRDTVPHRPCAEHGHGFDCVDRHGQSLRDRLK
jgi:hypothetical protein